jgi:hypothetical protein
MLRYDVAAVLALGLIHGVIEQMQKSGSWHLPSGDLGHFLIAFPLPPQAVGRQREVRLATMERTLRVAGSERRSREILR